MEQLTARQRATKKQDAARKGTPTFSSIRLSNTDEITAADKKAWLDSVVSSYGQTREQALLKAFELLEQSLREQS